MSAITFQVSDDLASQLLKYEGRVPEILERGIRNLEEEDDGRTRQAKNDATQEILAFLANLPAPEEILRLEASQRLQQRVRELLEKNRDHGLTSHEEAELDHYERVEHLVRLAKIKAAGKLALGSAKHA